MSSITTSVPPYRIPNHSGGRCGYHHSLEYLIYYLIQYGLNYIRLVAFIGDYGIGLLFLVDIYSENILKVIFFSTKEQLSLLLILSSKTDL